MSAPQDTFRNLSAPLPRSAFLAGLVTLFFCLVACERKDPAIEPPEPPTAAPSPTALPREDPSTKASTPLPTPLDNSSNDSLRMESPIQPAELVISDAAVFRDSELMSGGPIDQRLAAAERLLQVGTDESLAALVAIMNGSPREEKVALGQWLSQTNTVSQRESLLRVLPLADRETARALATSLGSQADADFLASVANSLGFAGSRLAEANMLAVVRNASSPDAVGVLLQIVADNPADDPLVTAAAQALVASGTPPSVDAVIQKIDQSADPNQIAALSAILVEVSDPRAQQTLLYAARGNKAASKPSTRIAAIQALANYPTPETSELLKQLQSDTDAEIRDTAAKILNDFQ